VLNEWGTLKSMFLTNFVTRVTQNTVYKLWSFQIARQEKKKITTFTNATDVHIVSALLSFTYQNQKDMCCNLLLEYLTIPASCRLICLDEKLIYFSI